MSDNQRVSAATAPIIRPAVVDDAEPMARYHHRCSIEFDNSIPDAGSVRSGWIQDCAHTVHVAESGGAVIAHLVTRDNEIVHLFVDPDHWGSGLGRRLLEFGGALIRGAATSPWNCTRWSGVRRRSPSTNRLDGT